MTTASQDLASGAVRADGTSVLSRGDNGATSEAASAINQPEFNHRSGAWQHRLSRRVALADGSAVVAVAAVAWALTYAVSVDVSASVVATLSGTALLAWVGTSTWARRRDRGLAVDGTVRYLPSVGAAAAAFAAVCVALAVLGATLPVALLVAPFVVGGATGFLARGVVRRWAARGHAAGLGRRTVVVVGTSTEISTLGPALTAIGDAIDVLGACVTDEFAESEILLNYENHSKASVRTIAVLGSADRTQEVAASLGADTVLLTSTPKGAGNGLSSLAWQLDQIGTTLSLLSSTNDIDDSRVQREVIGSSTLVHIARPTYRGALRTSKRATDLAISIALLLVLGLPMLAIAVVIRLSSRGKALFSQERVGLNGKHFTMLKFRSMVADAEDQLPNLEHQQDAGNAVMFKMKDDPRVTRIGSLLRKTSLDELPQLINVLRGDMSLVGPRPPLPTELAQYGDDAQLRFLVKPGITGLWQVSGRSDLTWEQTVRCDRRYVENWSMSRDMTIIARTARAMNKGAY